MNKLLFFFGLFLLCTLGYAHEFWLEPIKFLLALHEKVRIHLMVGEDYSGEHSNGHKYKIQKEDVRSKVYGDSLSRLDLSFSTGGSHLIAFNNTSKFIELEAAKFNDYLRSEGLDNVIQLRTQKGDTLKAGRELYQRCVKTLIQVDGKNDESYAINTGMRLEIIPAQNPYAIKSKAQLTFKVLFDNAVLINALVLAWHVDKGKATHTLVRSNKKGEVTFPIVKTGKWMISTVHMISTDDSKAADWQSFWGSYTFGYY
jgi:uncharacterized GH25 family protein